MREGGWEGGRGRRCTVNVERGVQCVTAGYKQCSGVQARTLRHTGRARQSPPWLSFSLHSQPLTFFGCGEVRPHLPLGHPPRPTCSLAPVPPLGSPLPHLLPLHPHPLPHPYRPAHPRVLPPMRACGHLIHCIRDPPFFSSFFDRSPTSNALHSEHRDGGEADVY